MGRTILFDTFVEEIITENIAAKTRVFGIRIKGKKEILPVGVLVLAWGNSAHDTYRMLQQKGVRLQAKPFAIRLRIEHAQAMIDWAQYGVDRELLSLPVADYHLTWKDFAGGRGFTVFVCAPAAVSSTPPARAGGVVKNGMSNAARASGRANSALVVTVGKNDFEKDFEAGKVGTKGV